MKTSAAGIALIERFEGLRLQAYRDGAGNWSIGYGHLEPSTPMCTFTGGFETQAEAEATLCVDLGTAEAAVSRLVSVPLTQGQFDALVSWTFNEGQGRLAGSALLRELNAGDYGAAAAAFAAWDMIAGAPSAGLIARRAAEAALFRS